ncbi:hypothetical protein Vadar_031362 [Vaccinium darrowii]|uniref:Uncharacterized protein n=1 Tax=Vaccinium darrowii TaxID=229202 RepID=A0ACB7YS34_9ERIC|nr:hypothetical protein Vadar_031362 [Vaccinium darrowii]
MERKAIVICSIVGFLGLLSAGLGFAAQAKRVKVINRPINSYLQFLYIQFVRVYAHPKTVHVKKESGEMEVEMDRIIKLTFVYY